MTVSTTALVLGACGDDVRYAVSLYFDFGDAGVPASDDAALEIRVDVCLEGECPALSDSAMLAPEATAEGSYAVPLSMDPTENRIVLVAREDSRIGSVFSYRAWVHDGRCCALFCSEGFVRRGRIVDTTATDSVTVPEQVLMSAESCGVTLCTPDGGACSTTDGGMASMDGGVASDGGFADAGVASDGSFADAGGPQDGGGDAL